MENLVSLMLGLICVSGIVGLSWRLRVAAFLLTTESFDSPHRARRWVNRYLIFSFYYLLSFLFSSVLAQPIMRLMEEAGVGQLGTGIAYLLLCLPMAWLLLVFDFWLARRSDGAKRRGRTPTGCEPGFDSWR
ncbi:MULTISPECIES: hypothetical protein [unclassified Pseudoxanthomonas]|uniref:hypothetical protein n=1 Tax=unclassified Pseudoxanthomonas TaxID=2645906 RepID=UPI00307881E9